MRIFLRHCRPAYSVSGSRFSIICILRDRVKEDFMPGLPESLHGLRQELRDFMRGCETLLSLACRESLTTDEMEIVRYYMQTVRESCKC